MTEGITGETGELNLTDIADEIRTQLNERTSSLPLDISNAIAGIKVNNSILGTMTITQNGLRQALYDGLDGYASVEVNVPTGATPENENKVVSSGNFIPQTSITVTENGTVDTTFNNEVVVNVDYRHMEPDDIAF